MGSEQGRGAGASFNPSGCLPEEIWRRLGNGWGQDPGLVERLVHHSDSINIWTKIDPAWATWELGDMGKVLTPSPRGLPGVWRQ